jgi:hypothetical protein
LFKVVFMYRRYDVRFREGDTQQDDDNKARLKLSTNVYIICGVNKSYMYCDVLPVNTSNNLCGYGFLYLDLLDVTSGGITITCNISNYIT